MKKLHKVMYRSFFGPFLAAFVIILFILALQFLSRYMDDLLGRGIGNDVLAKVFGLACVTLVTMALPLAVLMSSLLTMGNMGERYELAAMKSAGIGLFKTMRPMLNFTLVVVSMAFFFSFYLIPQANLKLFTLIHDVSKVKPTFSLKENHFYTDIDNYSIHVGDIDRENDMLYKVKIYDHTGESGNRKITLADSGRMVPTFGGTVLKLDLYSGVNHEETIEKKEGEPQPISKYTRLYFDSLSYQISTDGFNLEKSDENTYKNHQYMLNIIELRMALDSLYAHNDTLYMDMKRYMAKYLHADTVAARPGSTYKLKDNTPAEAEAQAVMTGRKGDHAGLAKPSLATIFPLDKRADVLSQATMNARAVKNYSKVVKDRIEKEEEKARKYEIEFQFRLVLPIACLVFLFIGAPLGAIVRKGGVGIPIIVSIGFFILFYILMIQGKKLASDDVIPLWLGSWLPIVVMMPMSLVFTYQSATDSPLLFFAGSGQLFWKLGKFFSEVGRIFALIFTLGIKGRKKKKQVRKPSDDVWDDVDAAIQRRQKNLSYLAETKPQEEPPKEK